MRFSTRSTNPTGVQVGARRSDARSDPVLGARRGPSLKRKRSSPDLIRPSSPRRHLLDGAGVLAKPTSLAPKVLVLQVQPVDLTGQPLVLATRLDGVDQSSFADERVRHEHTADEQQTEQDQAPRQWRGLLNRGPFAGSASAGCARHGCLVLSVTDASRIRGALVHDRGCGHERSR